MPSDCSACRLIAGAEPLPGGRLCATAHWVVEHCTGPLGVGTLLVKPFRHCPHIGDLTQAESQELGPLLQRVSQTVQALTQADQVYVCLWSHAGWTPGHIHFVVQPAWNRWRAVYARPGPGVQSAMFQAGNAPAVHEVEAFCQQARNILWKSSLPPPPSNTRMNLTGIPLRSIPAGYPRR
jgi:diadenosine tetraphosphate (Ap4A) HIT family hydrolase